MKDNELEMRIKKADEADARWYRQLQLIMIDAGAVMDEAHDWADDSQDSTESVLLALIAAILLKPNYHTRKKVEP